MWRGARTPFHRQSECSGKAVALGEGYRKRKHTRSVERGLNANQDNVVKKQVAKHAGHNLIIILRQEGNHNDENPENKDFKNTTFFRIN